MDFNTELEGGQQEPQEQPSAPPERKHPIAVFFHLFWKAAAIILYLCLSYLLDNYVVTVVVVLVVLAADFWTVKNVTGRLLARMRYWHKVHEDGSTEWRFEMGEGGKKIEKVIFWAGLLGVVLLWLLFGVWAIFSLNLKWLVIVALALLLSCGNIVGYVRCLASKKDKFKSMATAFITQKAVEHVANNPSSLKNFT